MKKNTPKILAVVLLSTIAILMIIAGSGSLKSVFNADNFNEDTPPSVDAVGNESNPPSTDDNPIKEPESAIPDVEHFPIHASMDGIHRYEQKLNLSGPILEAVHSTSEGSYVIFTHETSDGPFKVSKRTQTIILIDEQGTILSAYSLKQNMQTSFLASRVAENGLVVAVKDAQKSYLYTLSYDFKQLDLIELPVFNSAMIYTLSNSLLLFGEGKERTLYKIFNNTIVATNSIQQGSVMRVFDFGTQYLFFLSGINGYSCVKLSEDLKLISTITIQDKTLLAVEPIVENGIQKYILAENSHNGVEIVKYDNNFSQLTAERVGVGLAESASVYMNGESLFLLLKASSPRLYLVDKSLNFTSSNNTTFQGLTEMYDCYTHVDGYSVLYAKGETLTLTEIRNDGIIHSLNLDAIASRACVFIARDLKTSVVYVYGDMLNIIGLA